MRIKKDILLLAIVLLFSSLFFIQKINLATADLGRHLKNGELFFSTLKPISTNFYSYTNPEFKVINHHWGFGPIVYIIYRLSGFIGISFAYFIMAFIVYLTFSYPVYKRINSTITIFSIILSMPLVSYRVEIRPEIISALFMGLLFNIFYLFKEKKIKIKFVLLLSFLIQVLWVNIHIFFPAGLLITSIFLFDDLVSSRKNAKNYLLIIVSQVTALFINPFGLSTVLFPFNILKSYGYRIVENQSVLFMQNLFPQPILFLFMSIFVLFALLLIYCVFDDFKAIKKGLIYILPALIFGLASWKFIRLIPFFGYFSIIGFTFLLNQVFTKRFPGLSLVKLNKSILLLCGSFLALNLFFKNSLYSPIKSNFGFGILPGMLNSLKFFEENKLKGPIFNNYDNGGYLIYGLFPDEKVFVDNRPEAYSTKFFSEEYIAVQEVDELWQKELNKYNFNVIYFYRNDLTPWGQQFLEARVIDPNWKLVYSDDFFLIFTRILVQ